MNFIKSNNIPIMPLLFEPRNLLQNEYFKLINPEIFMDRYKNISLLPIYQISNYGRVFNTYSGNLEEETMTHQGYCRVKLIFVDKFAKPIIIEKAVDELVLQTFDYQFDKEEYWIKHINSNVSDNQLSNLRWIEKTQIRYNKKNKK